MEFHKILFEAVLSQNCTPIELVAIHKTLHLFLQVFGDSEVLITLPWIFKTQDQAESVDGNARQRALHNFVLSYLLSLFEYLELEQSSKLLKSVSFIFYLFFIFHFIFFYFFYLLFIVI